MGSRGRKSSASLAVAAPVKLEHMPEAPAYLTPEQDDIWRLVISSAGGDLISPESYPVLVEYCRAVVSSNQIAAQLDAFDPEWAKDDEGLKRWDKLLQMQEREARKIASLAVKLRLTPSTRVHPEKAGTVERKGVKLKPWEMFAE